MEKPANWVASESGSRMLMAVLTTTSGILLAIIVRKKIWPLAILVAKFLGTKIWPLAILLAKFVLETGCALAGLTTSVLNRIFQHIASKRATVASNATATNGAENNVESHEIDGGRAPGRAQSEEV